LNSSPNLFGTAALFLSNNYPIAIPHAHDWKYKVLQTYKLDKDENVRDFETLPKLLKSLDPSRFRSVSQARKACRLGEVILFRKNGNDPTDSSARADEEYRLENSDFTNLGEYEDLNDILNNRPNITVCSSSSTVIKDDVVVIRSRADSTGAEIIYPTEIVGYIHPPDILMSGCEVDVIYDDATFCLVNKPEMLTTVGEKRDDLQSILPYILGPPPNQYWSSLDSPPLPRPVHRLDRKTSGLVLVAKTKESMSHLSNCFSIRSVEKSYAAIVFGRPNSSDEAESKDGVLWNTIDYPIDGKSSITRWRIVCSIDTKKYGQLTLLLCRPKTGRYHQIRRHLSYCLGTAIVGDSKYDGGGERERAVRSLGMFLCSNAIEFKYPADELTKKSSSLAISKLHTFDDYAEEELLGTSCNSTVTMVNYDTGDKLLHLRAKVPLPEKFRTILTS
jgi:23S rRNA-/tRNA-specific pseudouridylate synthase